MSRCPDSPWTLGLPKDTWWPGQQQTVDLILDAFLDHGKKYVMAGISTGGGKTIIAAAVQKLLSQAGIGVGNSLALTHTIQLQHQYIETLPEAKVLIGRRNFPCELPDEHIARIGYPQMTARDAPCASGVKCDSGLDNAQGCGYYRQRGEAIHAPMVVTNYAMAPLILMPEDTAGYNPFRRTLLVTDECHLAEGAIRRAAGCSCLIRVLEDIGIPLPSLSTKTTVTEGRSTRSYETIAVWVAWGLAHQNKIRSMYKNTGEQLKSLRASEAPSEDEAKKIAGKIRHLNAIRTVIETLAGIREDDQAAWMVNRGPKEIVVQPLWSWSAAPRLLWRHFDRVLLMSATPGDPEIERIKLGIPKDEFMYIERPSNFPVENRPVYFWPVVKLSHTSTMDDWKRIGQAIMQIAESAAYKNRKGLVHSGSAENAKKLVWMLSQVSDRFFTHDGTDKMTREEALDEFKRSPDPRVLVTASFTTGLDLPYIIGWQVIAKVPFGSLADEITSRRKAFVAADGTKFGQRVYTAEAMNTVVQAAGRIVRAPDDSGPTFILDANYQILHKTAYAPQFYLDAYQRFRIE